MKRLRDNQSIYGFTLLEMLVVVSITMVVVGFGTFSYNKFRIKQTTLQNAEKLASEIRLVKRKVDSGERKVGCTPLNGYRIVFTSVGGTVSAICNSSPVSVSSFTMNEGVSLTTTSGDTLDMGVLSTLLTGTTAIAVEFSGCSVDVDISPSGEVSVDETSVSC